MKKMTIGDRLVLDAKLVRRALRRWRQQVKYRQWSLHDVPILFANSFPKSGTHLLTQVLEGFAQIGPAVISGLPAIVTFQGNTGGQRAAKDILADIDRLMPGDIAYGHLHAIPAMTNRLCQTGMAGFFILRDPRDVVVSHVYYVTDMAPNHIHHRYYAMELKTFDERLRASILGILDTDIPFPDIAERFNPYLGWLEHEEILTLHYEDFMGGGGGSAFGRMIDHALVRGFPLMVSRDAALRALAESVDPQRSPTFRSGKIGGWKNQFNDENKQLFKEVAGELLIRLGYEEDIWW